MFNCFTDVFDAAPLDQEPRRVGHKLAGHPAPALDNISRLIRSHPKEWVVCSKGLLKNDDDFENAGREHSNGLSIEETIEETIETIRPSNSCICVVSPETSTSFKDLHRELVAGVEAVHIPFVAGHCVRNGSDDVSISMSIVFNTEQSLAWRRAIAFNRVARPHLRKVGVSPAPVGARPVIDRFKAGVWARAATVTRSLQGPQA